MVERFERNKLYINSNLPAKIVKCVFVSGDGSAVLEFVCKNPDHKGEISSIFREALRRTVLSASPENWDEFQLPSTPGETMFAYSFVNGSNRRTLGMNLYQSSVEALEYSRRALTTEKRPSVLIHPIEVRTTVTLEEFVRRVEQEEETI